MATIYHQVGIKAPINDVYNAIATTEGVTGWWTKTSGNPETGGDLEFSFDGEWLGTRICFDLVEQEHQVIVNFQHTDWKAATEMLAHCSTKWAVFLLSLKEYLETGTGQPFPHDIPINHSVFN